MKGFISLEILLVYSVIAVLSLFFLSFLGSFLDKVYYSLHKKQVSFFKRTLRDLYYVSYDYESFEKKFSVFLFSDSNLCCLDNKLFLDGSLVLDGVFCNICKKSTVFTLCFIRRGENIFIEEC